MTFSELIESGIIARHWLSREHVIQTEGQRILYVGKMGYDESSFVRLLNRFGRCKVKRIEGHRDVYHDLLITLADN